MRILVLNWQDRLNPQAGGAEAHVHEVFGRLAAQGHQVTLLASGWEGAVEREWLDGIDVRRAGTRYTYGLAAPRYYRAALAPAGFDVVVEALNKVPVFSPLWAGVPTVLLVHHLFGATAFREASFPLAALTWLLERPLSRVYQGVPVQAISRSTADDLVERGIQRRAIRVIYPGVDLDFFTPGGPGSRAALPTFLYLGRLKRYKGVEIVLEALARLNGDASEARLVIAGKGEWEPALRAAAIRLGVDQRVDFAGFVSEERKRELMRSAWANVFPSPKEGWGITNLEAAACGTPTVASDSPGLRESVVDGETGLLVAHGDPLRLAEALQRLAGSPARVREMGLAGRAFAQDFTWEHTAEETQTHLQEVLNTRGHLSA